MPNQSPNGSRATSIEELAIIFNNFWNDAAWERGLAFQPNVDDIIIAPFTKCGTTLLQQIAHGLRTRGSMDFDEISTVTPWLEIAYDVGWDLDAPQVAGPRVYKSHATWYAVPKGARYIVSFRHYHDVLVSTYRFFEGWFFEPDAISLEEFVQWRCPRDTVGSQGYWYHLGSWWEQRHNENVLLLCYEDMVADLTTTISKIADFLGISLDDELLNIVTHQSSREFMLAHSHQFDTHHIVQIGGKRAGLPPAIDTNKVTPGTPNKARYRLSPEIKHMLDDIWQEQITTKFGLETFNDLRQALSELYQS
jgi:hypothetical protein